MLIVQEMQDCDCYDNSKNNKKSTNPHELHEVHLRLAVKIGRTIAQLNMRCRERRHVSTSIKTSTRHTWDRWRRLQRGCSRRPSWDSKPWRRSRRSRSRTEWRWERDWRVFSWVCRKDEATSAPIWTRNRCSSRNPRSLCPISRINESMRWPGGACNARQLQLSYMSIYSLNSG